MIYPFCLCSMSETIYVASIIPFVYASIHSWRGQNSTLCVNLCCIQCGLLCVASKSSMPTMHPIHHLFAHWILGSQVKTSRPMTHELDIVMWTVYIIYNLSLLQTGHSKAYSFFGGAKLVILNETELAVLSMSMKGRKI